MLYGLLLTIFVMLGFFLIIFVLVQQSKSSLGLGSMGQTQMLFGGSGGQNFFQKVTWGMGALFMLLSFVLSIMNSSKMQLHYIKPSMSKQQIIQETPEQNTQEAVSNQTEESTQDDHVSNQQV